MQCGFVERDVFELEESYKKILLRDPSDTIIPCEVVSESTLRFLPTVPGQYVLMINRGTNVETCKLSVTLNIDTNKDKPLTIVPDSRLFTLETRINPHQANHSYNGIMFDVQAKGPEDIEVLGFEVGGSLGPTKIYVSADGWSTGKSDKPDKWSLIVSRSIQGSENTTTMIPLSFPVVILGKNKRGFYIHCEVYDDEALKYQTYNSYDSAIAQDKNVAVYPGQARCGHTPFLESGRWRKIRGFSGSVIYRAIKKVWSPHTHFQFPPGFREVVRLLLLMWYREGCILNTLPQEAVHEIIQFMDWDWFENPEDIANSVISEVGSSAESLWDVYW